MSNHFHGIIIILDNASVRAKHLHSNRVEKINIIQANASPLRPTQQDKNFRPTGTQSGSLSAIVQNYSSITTRKINQIRETPGQKLWQRNFYEHIIRNEKELDRIRKYINENPLNWKSDQENPGKWKKNL